MTKLLAITTAALALLSIATSAVDPPATRPSSINTATTIPVVPQPVAAGGASAAIAPALRQEQPPATRPSTQPAALVLRPMVLKANVVVNGPVVVNGVNNMADLQRRQLESQKNSIKAMQVSATYKLDDLLHLSLVDGLLRAETSLTASSKGQNRVEVSDAGGMWLVSCQDLRRRASVGLMITINRFDFDKGGEGEYWRTSLNLNDQYLMIHEQGIDGGAWFQQINGSVHLNVTSMKNGRGQQLLNIQAADLLRLHAEHPDAVRKYLVPMLIRMTGHNLLKPGAGDVYSVFTEVPPDPTVARSIAKLLPALDAELFSERDEASHELAKLGASGVLAALRLDRKRLTTEQKARIDAYISTERRRPMDDPQAMRQDVNFLIDALEDDDQLVRVAAKACLETVLGHSIDFDTALPAGKRGEALDAVRTAITQPPASPTTRPHGLTEALLRPLVPLRRLLPIDPQN